MGAESEFPARWRGRPLETWNVRRTEDAHKVVRRTQKLIRGPMSPKAGKRKGAEQHRDSCESLRCADAHRIWVHRSDRRARSWRTASVGLDRANLLGGKGESGNARCGVQGMREWLSRD